MAEGGQRVNDDLTDWADGAHHRSPWFALLVCSTGKALGRGWRRELTDRLIPFLAHSKALTENLTTITYRFMQAALPVPSELRLLEVKLDALSLQLDQLVDLSTRLDELLQARKGDNGRMELPVELGAGFSVEGVV